MVEVEVGQAHQRGEAGKARRDLACDERGGLLVAAGAERLRLKRPAAPAGDLAHHFHGDHPLANPVESSAGQLY